MPRIRSLKPEHKSHRKVGPLSHFLYRRWVGLVTEADDSGRLVADPGQLRVLIFPYHPIETPQRVQAGLENLARIGLCQRYVVDGVPYAALPSWPDHQRVSHPAKSVLPAPPLERPPEGSGGRTRKRARIPEDSGGASAGTSGKFRNVPGGGSGTFLSVHGGSEGIRSKNPGGEGSVRGGESRQAARLRGAPPREREPSKTQPLAGTVAEFMATVRAAAAKTTPDRLPGEAGDAEV